MNRISVAACAVVIFAVGVVAGGQRSGAPAGKGAPVMECGGASAPQVRMTLYFGLTRAKGPISELEWQIFLRDEVTRRFPDGFTAWDAEGQWRNPSGVIEPERTKVLLLVHPDTLEARRAVQEMIATYRTQFDQQSVLWESSRVCVSS